MKIKKQIVMLIIVIGSYSSLFANGKWMVGANIGSMFSAKESIANTEEGRSSKLLDINSSIKKGKVYGMFVGYRQSKNILFSFSYQQFGDYDANFTLYVPEQFIGDNLVKGKISSEVALINVDYLLTQLSFKLYHVHFTPYVGIGAGMARNEFNNITQSYQGNFDATIESHKVINPAAQARIGINAALTQYINLGLVYEITGVGGFSSGDERTDRQGYQYIIEPYNINNVFYNTAQLVFTYRF